MMDQTEQDQRISRHKKRNPVLNPAIQKQTVQLCPDQMPAAHAPAGTWVNWIACQVPLLPADVVYIRNRLSGLPGTVIGKTSVRYVQLWIKYAEAEPAGHRKQNAGRAAANRSLLHLVG